MKKKAFFLFAALSLMLAACNTNEPTNESIIGTWSEPYHVKDGVKSITFNEDGTLFYLHKVDTTWSIQPTIAPIGANQYYSITEDDKLCISGRGRYVDIEAQKVDTLPFMFITDYNIKGDTLTIDTFAYDGGLESRFIKSIILYKL